MTVAAPQSGGRSRPVPRAVRRRAVPTVLQFEAVECGAASLSMILARFGRRVPMEEMRLACGVSRDGAKASNMLKAARSYGLEAKGYRKELSELGDLPMPVIVHWNFEHFLVLEGFDQRHVWVNDPALGPRRMTWEAFDRGFTGVVLSFVQGPAFIRGGALPGLWSLMCRRLAGCGNALWLVGLLALCLVLTGVILPAAIRVFVDGVMVSGQAGWVFPVIAGLALTAIARQGLNLMQQSLLLQLNTRIAVTGTARLVWHLLRLPMAFFTQRHAGEIASRVGSADDIARVLSGELSQTFLRLAEVAFYGAILIALDPLLGGAVVALSIPNLLVLLVVNGRLKRGAEAVMMRESRLVAATTGMIQGIETLRASGREGAAFRRWAGLHAQALNARRDQSADAILLGTGPMLLRGVASVAVAAFGALAVLDGRLTLGAFLAFQTLVQSFLGPIAALVSAGTDISALRADLMRVEDALGQKPDQATNDPPERPHLAGQAAVPAAGQIEIHGLSFGYSPLAPPLLQDINLTVAPGQRLAVVGASGSGKSTLGRIIAGLVPPWSGEVRIDGVALSALSRAEKLRLLGYVDQDIFLFGGTVRENLTLWQQDVPDAALIRALGDAAVLDDVIRKPGGLDATMREGGMDFSGGQRQRLEIARALVADPAILVLDEATSALDPVVEKEIDDRLRRRGVTCILIAHRLSTVRDCDEILVMDAGRIVERGTHEALMALGGDYANLIRGA